ALDLRVDVQDADAGRGAVVGADLDGVGVAGDRVDRQFRAGEAAARRGVEAVATVIVAADGSAPAAAVVDGHDRVVRPGIIAGGDMDEAGARRDRAEPPVVAEVEATGHRAVGRRARRVVRVRAVIDRPRHGAAVKAGATAAGAGDGHRARAATAVVPGQAQLVMRAGGDGERDLALQAAEVVDAGELVAAAVIENGEHGVKGRAVAG